MHRACFWPRAYSHLVLPVLEEKLTVSKNRDTFFRYFVPNFELIAICQFMTWASTFMYSIIGRTQHIAWIYLHSWNLFIVDIADFFLFVHYMSYACHIPYAIWDMPQCYLPSGRGDIPAFTPTKLVHDLDDIFHFIHVIYFWHVKHVHRSMCAVQCCLSVYDTGLFCRNCWTDWASTLR